MKKLKDFFQKKEGQSGTPKFTKKKPNLRPRAISQKTANMILAGVLVGFFVLGTANVAVNSVRLAKMAEAKPVVVVDKQSRNISNKVGLFMSDFLSSYFRRGQDVTQSQLDSYYGPDVDIKNTTQASLESKLLSATLIEITDDLATYRVTYEVTRPEGSKTLSRVINIPYAEKDGKFYVSGLPYFTNIENYVAEGLEDSGNSLKQQLGASDYESERVYVEAFFKAYTSGDVAQMSPFSKNLTPIDGFQFVSLDYTYFFEDGGHIVALAQVTLVDSVGFPHQENFSLRLTKQASGSYFVEDLKHSLVEILEEK